MVLCFVFFFEPQKVYNSVLFSRVYVGEQHCLQQCDQHNISKLVGKKNQKPSFWFQSKDYQSDSHKTS